MSGSSEKIDSYVVGNEIITAGEITNSTIPAINIDANSNSNNNNSNSINYTAETTSPLQQTPTPITQLSFTQQQQTQTESKVKSSTTSEEPHHLTVNTNINEKTSLLSSDTNNLSGFGQQQQRPSTPGLTQIASYSHLSGRRLTKMGSATQLFLYTKSVPTPKLKDTIRTLRFVVRFAQLLVSIAALASAAFGAFNFNYPFYVYGYSGINFMILTSISSMFVSISSLFLYLFPSFLGVPPQRYLRFSHIEVSVDFVYSVFWLGAASAMASFGNCSRSFSSFEMKTDRCVSWNFSIAFGFVSSILFFGTFFVGIRDIRHHKNAAKLAGRGNWRDWGSDENLEGTPTISK